MALWSDIAEWVGPTQNRVSGGMSEYRGLVVHIMQGSYIGSVAWGKNPASSVSFHFATRADGHIGQLVDTDDAAWTQGNGNGHWLSVENEGYSGNELTAGQVEACAQIYARGVRDYGWHYQLADGTSGRGLGWHGMGGTAWGGHPDCPGAPIVAQRQQILNRARQINEGGTPSPPRRKDDDMPTFIIQPTNGSGIALAWPCDRAGGWVFTNILPPGAHSDDDDFVPGVVAALIAAGCVDARGWNVPSFDGYIPLSEVTGGGSGGGSGGGPSLAQIETVVDRQLDQQSRAGADQD